jgi:membrane-associated phospholipid phosphatase
MLNLIHNNRFFFYPYAILLILGGIIQYQFRPTDIMIWVNGHTYRFLDPFFLFLTDIGDGLAFGILIFVLLWINVGKAIQASIIFATSSITSQILKNFIFPHSPRPFTVLKENGFPPFQIKLIPGVQILMQHSFPSGHSLTGFSLALLLAFWINEKKYGFICLWLGLGIAYSRVYLFEHFLWDIYVGSLLGVLITLVLYYYLSKANWLSAKWAKKRIIPNPFAGKQI